MTKTPIPLTTLPENKTARIVDFQGGTSLHKKLNIMGIRKGQTIQIISKQPFRGPITVAVKGCQMTLGRGITTKIFVEVL